MCNSYSSGDEYFSPSFIRELDEFISQQDSSVLEVSHLQTSTSEDLCFCSIDGATILLLSVRTHSRLIIRNVALRNQRIGTFTEIVARLRKQLTGTSVQVLVVETVVTRAMRSWCLKNGLGPSLLQDVPEDGLNIDYVQNLK